MSITKYLKPGKIEKYSFLWSEVRLIVAAVALFVGGVPFIYFVFPSTSSVGLFGTLLTLSWIASGLASAYLGFRWFTRSKTLIGKKNKKDLYAFMVSVVSGLNLGITGLFKINPGMSVSTSQIAFIVFGIIYIASALHLYRRWRESGKKLF